MQVKGISTGQHLRKGIEETKFHKKAMENCLTKRFVAGNLSLMEKPGTRKSLSRAALPIYTDFFVVNSVGDAQQQVEKFDLPASEFGWALIPDYSSERMMVFCYVCPKCCRRGKNA